MLSRDERNGKVTFVRNQGDKLFGGGPWRYEGILLLVLGAVARNWHRRTCASDLFCFSYDEEWAVTGCLAIAKYLGTAMRRVSFIGDLR